MRKILAFTMFFILYSTPLFAASIYTTTIQETSVEQVQEVLIEVMTGKNFAIDEVTPYKVTFNKNFGDGFFIASRAQTVIFNLLARDGNIKMMVTQIELYQGISKRQRSIDHMIPIIKEVRNAIDGTPIDNIENEAVDQLPGGGNKREKSLGITISEKDSRGRYLVEKIAPGSCAADKQFAVGDVIIEINGRTAAEFEKKALDSYIANKWGEGTSIIFTLDRFGETQIITLKRE